MRLARKTVVGHWSRRGDARADRRTGRGRPAGWHEASRLTRRALRRQHARRRGDRGRQGRGAAAPGDHGQRLRRRRPRGGDGGGSTPAAVDALLAEYEERYELVPALRRDGERRESLVVAARIEAGAARVPERRRLRRVHRHLRGPARPAPAARDRRAAADGRRLRLRRRGGLEDRGARADRQADGDGPAGRQLVHGGLHLRPRRRGAARAGLAHARGLPVDRRRTAALRDPPALDRRARGPGPAGVRRRARAGVHVLDARPGRSLPPARQRDRRDRAAAASCRSCRSRGRSGSRGPTSPPRRRPGSWRAARTTASSARRCTPRRWSTSRRSPDSSCC